MIYNIFKNKDKGFTLLEVLIAFIMTSISVAAALNALSMSNKLIKKGEEEKEVARIAEFLLANLDADPYFLKDMKPVSGSFKGNEERWSYFVEFNDVAIEGFEKNKDETESLKEMTLHLIAPSSKKEYLLTTWVLHSKKAEERKTPGIRGKKDHSPSSILKGRRGF